MKGQWRVDARDGQHAVIVCHPDPDSFNHAIADTYCDTLRTAADKVVVRDLYAMGFDPVLKADERPTLSTSAMSNVWLAREGQEHGLDSVFDDYIVHAFGMPSCEHKRFGPVTGDLSQRSVDQFTSGGCPSRRAETVRRSLLATKP